MSGTGGVGDNPLGRVLRGATSPPDGRSPRREEGKEELREPPLVGSASSSSDAAALPKSDETAKAYGNQEVWQEQSTNAKTAMGKMMAAGFDFRSIMQFAQGSRQEIANLQKTPGAEEFGDPRLPWDAALRKQDPKNAREYIDYYTETYGADGAKIVRGVKTPMGERYAKGGADCLAAFQSGQMKLDGVNFAPCTVPGNLAATPQSDSLRGRDLIGYRSLGRIGDKTIELTASVFVSPDASGSDASGKAAAAPIGIWLHTPAENIPPILDHVADLHAQLFPPKTGEDGAVVAEGATDEGVAIDLAARMAWWLTQAMPTVRGSASLVEWYVEAALAQCKVALGKPAVSLDQTAFRMSEEEFVRNFASFFKAEGDAPAPSGDGASSSSSSASSSTSGAPPSALYEAEIAASRLLHTNNCLINAIARAAGRVDATDEQLIVIRSRLHNIGEMMFASQRVVGVIREALGIANPVTVHYPNAAPETFPGEGVGIAIHHTGRMHFDAGPPRS